MSRRMRVLVSAFACEPEKGSEPEVGWQWALQIARFHDVTVLTQTKNRAAIERGLSALGETAPKPRFVYFELPKSVQTLRKFSIGLRIYYVFWQRWAWETVEQLNQETPFDLLHHVTFAAFRYPTVIWGHGVPCIWGPIGGIESIPVPLLPWDHPVSFVEEVFRNLSNLLQAAPYRDLPKRAAASNKVLVSTREMQETLARLEIQSQLMPTIGLKTGELPFQPRTPHSGPLRILFVGKIITLKGIDLALKALNDSETDATLTLVGTGNYQASAMRMVRKFGFEKRVVFRGQVTRQEVLALYRDFDVLLFPSLHDTGGYAVIEAMFNELPVICLDCGGPPVAVESGCGIKVPVSSRREVVAGLAAAIREYDKNRQMLASHGKAARESILKNYDWDKKGEQMNDVYQNTLAQAATRPVIAYNRLTLGRILSLPGSVLAAAALLLIGLLGFLTVSQLKNEADNIVNSTLPALSYAGEANAYIVDASRTLYFVTTDDPNERAKLRDQIAELSRRTTSYLQEYGTRVTSAEDQQNFETLQKLRAQYVSTRDQVLDLASSGKRQESLALYSKALLPAHSAVKVAADKMFAYDMSQGEIQGKRIMRICTITQITLAITCVLIFLLGFFIGLFK